MREKIAKRWIRALESDQYEQCRNVLCRPGDDTFETNDSFCCLGVLTDIYLREKRDGWDETNSSALSFRENVAGLANEVLKWAGLKQKHDFGPNQGVWVPSLERHLTDLNDGYYTGSATEGTVKFRSMDFKEIAQVIRENWRDL